MSVATTAANSQPAKQPIFPTAFYSRKDLIRLTGRSQSTLIREEKKGRLRARRVRRTVGFLGQDVLIWLTGGDDE